MEKACHILFLWDGVWDCDPNSYRWRFIGKQSKTALISPNITFAQLHDKAYALCRVSHNDFEIEMSSWLAFQHTDSLPPCPLSDDDDVQILVQLNTKKKLSVPLCLIMKEKEKIVPTQDKREPFESECSNYDAPIQTNETIVPETQQRFIPLIIDKGKCIANDGLDGITSGLPIGEDESDSIFSDDLDENACPFIGEQVATVDYMLPKEDDMPLQQVHLTPTTACISFPPPDPTYVGRHVGGHSGGHASMDVGVHSGGPDRVGHANGDADGLAYVGHASEDAGRSASVGHASGRSSGPARFGLASGDAGGPISGHSSGQVVRGMQRNHFVGSGESGVGNKSNNPDSSCNSIAIENDFEVGQIFPNKDDLTRRLAIISMLKNREYKVKWSDKERFIAACVDPKCKWRIRVTNLKSSNVWAVKKYHNIHTCSLNIINHDHRQAKSNVEGEIIKYHYTTPTHACPPRAVIPEVKNTLGVNISYNKAWRSREEALKIIRGFPKDSFRQLPAFLERVKEVNPGTVTNIEINGNGHFRYCFMSLGALIRGFCSCIRPVLAVDATHLKGKYRGVLLLATWMDGNNQIYPVAFGIADSQNDASWRWFLENMSAFLENVKDLVIISDRHISIENAVKAVFPHAFHGLCMYHLRQNLTTRFKEVEVTTLYYSAAKTYNEAEFAHIMNVIHAASVDAYNFLIDDVKLEKWARVFQPAQRYSILTTNIVESMNSVLREVREYPPVALLDAILMKLVKWFAERREKAAKMRTVMTTWAENIVRGRDETARRMDIQATHHFTYYVLDGDRNAEVDLNGRTCTCNVFQLDQLPCAHALAAARKLNISMYGLASQFYTSDSLVTAYAEMVSPVGHVDFWNTPEDVSSKILLPPIMRVPSGRPRKVMIQSQGEVVVKKKCGRCGGTGHNRKTCKNPIPLGSSNT